ncbi:MAG: membrane-associated protease 1 [Lachnospiraceae bacterium]|nr:membrane-associated protease 1 [Lachnospiraceae bacterium]
MTVAGADTFQIPKECIVSTKFITDIPKNSDARTADVGTTLVVTGKILSAVDGDPFDSTRQMALWSTVPAKQAECYRSVTVENVRGNVVVRKYTIPNAFVVDYVESFGDTEGVGTFTLTIKQKKDRIEHVAVDGSYLI